VSEQRCPICREIVPADSAAPPFCSPRCRLIDLGQWLGGRYRIDGDDSDDKQREPSPSDATR
jgi:hypothetical protein